MNIAFVSNVVYPDVTGGAEKRIYEIARRLAAEGHTVTQYSRHYWDGPKRIEREGRESPIGLLRRGRSCTPATGARLRKHSISVFERFPHSVGRSATTTSFMRRSSRTSPFSGQQLPRRRAERTPRHL